MAILLCPKPKMLNNELMNMKNKFLLDVFILSSMISSITVGVATKSHLKKKIQTLKTTVSLSSTISHSTVTNPTTSQITTSIPAKAICNRTKLVHIKKKQANSTCHSPSDSLQCFHDPLYCKKSFQSGKRTLANERPQYGEYKYLNQDFWFRVIQHGGIVFLYNPCSSDKEIEELREVANDCLHRHVITPSEILGDDLPIALISWGCFYSTSSINKTDMKTWIRAHAFKGPASHVQHSGTFNRHLLKGSDIVTDSFDSVICPNETQMKRFTTTTTAPVTKLTKSVGEKILHDRIHHIRHGNKPSIQINANFTSKKVHPGSAAWAASSLFFLCGILFTWLLYLKGWAPTEKKNYNYEQVLCNEYDLNPPSSGGFSLIKSRQTFINIFRTDNTEKAREKKLDSLSSVNLMIPINEADEDSEDFEL